MATDKLTKTSHNDEEVDHSQVLREIEPACDLTHTPDGTDIPVDLDKATKLPFAELASLGTGFASLPAALRSAKQTVSISGNGLLRVTDKFGNPLDIGVLQPFNDGSGLMGSFRDATNGFGQARLHEVTSQTVSTATTVPYDPASLFMALTLMEINKKLDTIQHVQQEMFEYIRNKDKAALRGDLETLSDVLNNYRFNWDNDQYKNNKHILVQQIRNDAEKAIIQHRAQVKYALGDNGPIHIDQNVRDKITAVQSELEEYRLSVYLYSFASFLEIMLLRNFNQDYLNAIITKVNEHADHYEELFASARGAIEAEANSSVRAIALGGISGAMGFLGNALKGTPVGDLTPIDNALQDASRGIGTFNQDVKNSLLGEFAGASTTDVRPFVDSIKKIGHLYNDRVMLMADDETLYLTPITSEGR